MGNGERAGTRLDAALRIRPVGGGFEVDADSGYEAANGMLGGWTNAIVLAAIDAAEERPRGTHFQKRPISDSASRRAECGEVGSGGRDVG